MKLRGYLNIACVLAATAAAVGLLLSVPGCSRGNQISFREALTVGNLGHNPADPYLKVVPGGQVLASWTEQKPGHDGRDFFIAPLSGDGNLAKAPQQVNDQVGGLATYGREDPAKFTTNQSGDVVAVWTSPISGYKLGGPGSASQLWVAHGAPGASFTSAVNLNDDQEATNHAFTAIATSPSGKIYATWMDGRNHKVVGHDTSDSKKGARNLYAEDGSQLMMAVSEDGGKTFGKNYPITTDFSVCSCCRPTIVFLDGGETVVVSYRRVAKDFLRDHVVIRSTDGGKTFGEPVYISQDGWIANFCPHAGVSIATDSRQRIHAVWWTAGRTEQEAGIYYAYSEDGGKSFAPRQLIEGTPGRKATRGMAMASAILHAQLFVDHNDTLWIAWESMRDEKSQIFLTHRKPGATEWSAYYQLSDGTPNASFPVLVSDGRTLYTAWTERNGESSQVKVRTAKLG